MIQQGRVLKVYNSVLYVAASDGVVACKLRGKTKRQESGILPGDLAVFDRMTEQDGIVERILERKNLLQRPRVANLSQIVITIAAASPDPHPLVLNRFLVLAEHAGIGRIVICINKMDLSQDSAEAVLTEYERIGYPVLRVSAATGMGIALLREHLNGEITVFAGPSGTGKSSLLNAIDPSLALLTGAVSEKIGRGRHTTRRAELIPYEGGFVVDTPGFTQQELRGLTPQELADCFPEFSGAAGCRFAPCSHSHEPDCAVKDAVAAGMILSERYDAYLAFLDELQTQKKEENHYVTRTRRRAYS